MAIAITAACLIASAACMMASWSSTVEFCVRHTLKLPDANKKASAVLAFIWGCSAIGLAFIGGMLV